MLRLESYGYSRISQCGNFRVSFAGAEANVAVSLANYGMKVDYVSRYPDNDITQLCLSQLRVMDISINHSLLGGERLGILYLETGAVIRPSKVIYDRTGSSFVALTPGIINWENVFENACWFHWTGITPALSFSVADVCLEAVNYAKEKGLIISCDLNYRSSLWKYGKSASEEMPMLVDKCDIVIDNEEDCDSVFGIRTEGIDVNKTNGIINTDKYVSVCAMMQQHFPNVRIISLTLRGAINANHNTWQGILFTKGRLLCSCKYDITHIVDRVGVGDSFSGALIYGLLSNPDDKQKALEFAVATSCLKHTIQGDFNRFSVTEVNNLGFGNVSGRVQH